MYMSNAGGARLQKKIKKNSSNNKQTGRGLYLRHM